MEIQPALILVTIAAFLTTLVGGLFAFRFRDRLHLILGFSAGAVVGVAFFDLMPEALELASDYETSFVFSIVGLGFVIYLILDRIIFLHGHDDGHVHGGRGAFGAGSLALHSFLDGLGIGLAFQVSTAVGAIVATAVLVHKFSDGINAVSMIIKNAGSKASAMGWLAMTSLAPVLGIFSAFFFTVPQQTLGLLLALFAGFFFYIGASDLLPESHHAHPVAWTTISTVLGVVVMYVVIKLAGV